MERLGEQSGGIMAPDNKALVAMWFEEVWNKGRSEAIDDMMAPNCVVHGLGPKPQDIAAFKRFHAQYRDAFPDIRIIIEQTVAEGDVVAVRWNGAATHRGHGLGFAATNRRAQFGGMVFARVSDGKLVEGWNNFDQLGMLLQLGVVTLPA
jgi:predicted ester cyclase